MPEIEMIRHQLLPILSRYGVKKAILFGSYAKGTQTKNSDLDILVDSGLEGLKFVGLLEDITQAVHKDVDLFDVSHIVYPSLIASEIEKTGVTIYEQ